MNRDELSCLRDALESVKELLETLDEDNDGSELCGCRAYIEESLEEAGQDYYLKQEFYKADKKLDAALAAYGKLSQKISERMNLLEA